MNRFEIFKSLKRSEGGRMLLFVMDGLGGLPRNPCFFEGTDGTSFIF